MLSRLSRARVPFRRYIQTQSFPPTSTTTKYAIAVGTLATVAFLGTQTTQADNGPHNFSAPPPSPEHFQSYLLKKIEENPSPDHVLLRSLTVHHEQAQQELAREPAQQNPVPSEPEPAPAAVQSSAEEAEASGGDSGGGAFNPETGEINWDCPCLGGMAHGPCGPEFREAFSCFVYSEDEPKGINCVEKFQGMQTCFREHPDVYASEIADDEEAGKALEEGSAPEPEKSEGADNEKGSVPSIDLSSDSAPPSTPTPTPKPSEDKPSSEQ
ncbi:PX-domain-containing protein [Mycena venus]|uniref:Mitochondrial intermembrane space import and assembly protein 40 n=1 Tax=Mycena venus TaxID=2733690 RepID=A0A8H6YIF5_9AGAR|nr:PX-domain-containing protein [Mycena venus]